MSSLVYRMIFRIGAIIKISMMNEIVICKIGFERIYNYSITVLKSSYVNLIKFCFLRGLNGVYF